MCISSTITSSGVSFGTLQIFILSYLMVGSLANSLCEICWMNTSAWEFWISTATHPFVIYVSRFIFSPCSVGLIVFCNKFLVSSEVWFLLVSVGFTSNTLVSDWLAGGKLLLCEAALAYDLVRPAVSWVCRVVSLVRISLRLESISCVVTVYVLSRCSINDSWSFLRLINWVLCLVASSYLPCRLACFSTCSLLSLIIIPVSSFILFAYVPETGFLLPTRFAINWFNESQEESIISLCVMVCVLLS